jgi:hypothetical protein
MRHHSFFATAVLAASISIAAPGQQSGPGFVDARDTYICLVQTIEEGCG